MRNLLVCFALVTGITAVALSQTPSGKKPASGPQWENYGGKITLKKPTSLSKVLSVGLNEKEVLLEGTVTEVCQNKGCWLVLADDSEHIRVEFKDYEFFVPWESEGKKARLQGVLKEKTVSRKAAEHMAGEMKKPPVKSEEIQDKNTLRVFVARGVEIREGSLITQEQQDIIDGKKEREGHEHEEHDHE